MSSEDTEAPTDTTDATAGGGVQSWEVRLVLEYCDRGSLRDGLNRCVGGGKGTGFFYR